ncbi:hypothetical protein DYB32_004134 [Aphanomyces invadans]|uniref:F-box domain-containing protein n=1 Tax=Aphanomyces invadans TaxID=157072 RepID=A0A3R6VPF7_9STRA|nr:hypothetical protein DYB32_004134 [Aphanomyces invadans]
MSTEIAAPFDDLTEVIHAMGSPERVVGHVGQSADIDAVVSPVLVPVVDEPVVPPPPAPAVSKLTKPTSSVATKQLRKPVVKKEDSTEVVASKVKTTPVTSRLALGATRPSSRSHKTNQPSAEVKPAFFLMRLPRAVYLPLLSYFPIDSLKNLSAVSPEMYHLVNSHYTHWVTSPSSDADPTTQSLLADAMSKVQDARVAARDALSSLGDLAVSLKIEDLRVLRTYRNPPPAVLRLSKALVQVLRFAPPKGGIDARAAAGDWGVIKTLFLDLKIIVKALKTAVDTLTLPHPPPLSISRTHLDVLVTLAYGPELEEAKFNRICAALVPTLTATRKVAAAINAELRALDVTQLYKRHASDAVSETDIAAVMAKLVTPVLDATAQPEASPATSPTHATAKPKPSTTSRLVPKSTIALKRPAVAIEMPKPAVDKSSSVPRKGTPRPASAVPRPRLQASTVAVEDAATSSSNASTPRAATRGTVAKKVGMEHSKGTPSIKKAAPVDATATASEPRVIPKRTPLSSRAVPSKAVSVVAKRTSLSADATSREGTKATVSPASPATSMASLRADLEKAVKDLQSRTEALEAQGVQVAALADAKAALEDQLKQTLDQLADVKVQWELSQKEVQTQQAMLLEVKCVQETLQFRVNEMATVDAARSAELDALALEKEQLLLDVKAAQTQVAQSEAEAAEKAKALADAEDRYAQRELDLRESLLKSAEKDREALVAQMASLKREMETLQAEHHHELESTFVTAVQAEKANLVATLQAAQSNTFSLGQTVVQLQDELAREKKRVAAAELAYEESLRWHDAQGSHHQPDAEPIALVDVVPSQP